MSHHFYLNSQNSPEIRIFRDVTEIKTAMCRVIAAAIIQLHSMLLSRKSVFAENHIGQAYVLSVFKNSPYGLKKQG